MAHTVKDEASEYKILLGSSIHDNTPPNAYKEDDTIGFLSGKNDDFFGMSASQLSKHLLLIGGIGCGKTNTFNLIMDQLLRQMKEPEHSKDVMFVFDTKGDFKNMFYDPNDDRHAVIGNGPMYSDITKYWDIYSELTLDDKYIPGYSDLAAKEIAAQLFKGTAGESNMFFETTAADLFSMKLIDTLRRGSVDEDEKNMSRIREARNVRENEWNNRALVEFFQNANTDSYHDIIDRNPDFGSMRIYLGERNMELNGQSMGILAQINTVVNGLFIGIFGESAPNGSTKSTLSIRRIVRKKGGRVLFVEYDLSIGEKLGPIYRTLFDLALKEALGRTEIRDERDENGVKKKKEREGNVYFVVDEFKLLPNLKHIDDALNFGRSLGVKVFAGIQNVHQIYDIYGEERGRALFAGFMNCFAFQTPDFETREYVSKRMGSNYGSISYHMMQKPQIENRSGYTVEDWDLFDLKIGEACVDLVGVKPFLFQFAEFKQE